MTEAWKMTWTELKLFLRDPMAAFFTLVFPLMMLFLFGSIFGNEPDPQLGGRGQVQVEEQAAGDDEQQRPDGGEGKADGQLGHQDDLGAQGCGPEAPQDALGPVGGQVDGQAEQPGGGDDHGHVAGDRHVDRSPSPKVRVGLVAEDAAEQEQHHEGEHQGEEDRHRLPQEQLDLGPGHGPGCVHRKLLQVQGWVTCGTR